MPSALRDSSWRHRAGELPLVLRVSSMMTTRLACGEGKVRGEGLVC